MRCYALQQALALIRMPLHRMTASGHLPASSNEAPPTNFTRDVGRRARWAYEPHQSGMFGWARQLRAEEVGDKIGNRCHFRELREWDDSQVWACELLTFRIALRVFRDFIAERR